MSRLMPGETEDFSQDVKLMMALLSQLARSGVLNAGMIGAVRAEFLSEVQFYEGNSTQDDWLELVDLLDEFEESATGETESQFRAAQRRKSMRERTAHLTRIDGGKGD